MSRPRLILILVLVAWSMGEGTLAQNIPREEYLRYLPLEYPKLVRQTEANARFLLFGDENDAGYRDEAPRDGIDDRRNRVFEDLGIRFAPFMVLNTTSVPMDFARFMDGRASFPLYADLWLLGGPQAELVSTTSVDWNHLAAGPGGEETEADRRLLELLDEFDSENPSIPWHGETAVRPEDESFKVLFFDFPGEDPESWRREYEDDISAELPHRYRGFPKTFLHPFIHEHRNHLGESLGYELILQYWFFYPFNDGGNNHEGDWEHINVSIAPLSTVAELLDENALLRILDGRHVPDAADDPLVVRRIDYYFHNKVWPLDFSVPNAYASEEDWKSEMKRLPEERIGARSMWKQLRKRAWFDEDETVINTHPICLIGADNKGFDALLTSPGAKNRDSHGTYPFPGLYKDIGPGGATEAITQDFDHRKWYEQGHYASGEESVSLRRGAMVRFDDVERIRTIPDWERVEHLVRTEPAMRAPWAWMILPIRWGYPASESPFAGVVSHAETGNLAPVGPSYSMGWNTTGAARSFALYEPHRFSSNFPLGVQDNFHNTWGFFNLTLPVVLMLPPIDFIDRILLAPLNLIADPDPTYFPTETVPFRFVGLEAAYSSHGISDEWSLLYFNENQAAEILGRLTMVDPDVVQGGGLSEATHERAESGQATIAFFMGRGFVSENTLRHSRSDLGFNVGVSTQADPFRVTGDLNFWEYSGSLRYNFGGKRFLPFAKLGYGLSWYRIENASSTVPGGAIEPLVNSESPWVRKPNVLKWENMWPNTFSLAIGLEWLIIKSNGPLPRGTDLSFRAEFGYFHHKLGFNDINVDGIQVNDAGTDLSIWRPALSFGLMLGL